jgi:hypothetical protein
VVHLASKVLSPAAEAFRYFILEHGPAWLREHDDGLVPTLQAWEPPMSRSPKSLKG